MNVIESTLNAENKSFAIVVSRFNDFINQKLLEGSIDCIKRHGGDTEKLTVVWVPGAYEIPLMAKKLAKLKNFDAIICLGTVIRGATSHFDFVAGEVAKGVSKVSYETEIPTIFGVLTTDDIEQAIERAGTKSGNKGWDAALSAIEMANTLKALQ